MLNTEFNVKLAKLVEAKLKRDSMIVLDPPPVQDLSSESLGLEDSFSEEDAEDEGGEEEEDDEGSGGDGDEDDESDAADDLDPDEGRSEQPGPSGRFTVMVRKTKDPPKTYGTKDPSVELNTPDYGQDQEVVSYMRDRAKSPIIRGINDESGGASDMDISDIPEDAGNPFTDQPVLEELLMKEGSDPQEVSVVDMMLPGNKESGPEGNR